MTRSDIKGKASKRAVLDSKERFSGQNRTGAISEFSGEVNQTFVPQDELDLLCKAALGVTGQSRTCRYLLFLLVGTEEPTGLQGEGLVEMRAIDRKLADAFLRVVEWWRGPTASATPLYDVLRAIEDRFDPREDS